MDYTNLINDNSGKISKVGIIGATRGYGYTLLAQIPKVKHMQLRVISSRHTDECLDVLKEIGYDGCVVMEPFVVPGGSVGRDVHVWRNLFPELSADYLDKQAADSVKYLREQFEV